MKFRTMLAATICAAPLLPYVAKAQPVTGVYLGAGAGYTIMGHRSVKSITSGGVTVYPGSRSLFHNGYAGEASIGYGFGNGFRVELEGDYYDNRLKKLDTGANQLTASGSERKYGAMVNALYDFDIGSPYIYPYVGAGIGYQFARLHNYNVPFYDGGPSAASIDHTKGSLAYQALIGFSFPVPYMPGLSATVQYSYMALTGTRDYSGVYQSAPATFKFKGEANDTLMVGLRYELFPPMPPAPPPPAPTPVSTPAPAPARTYLVFFNWDKADLTPRAMQIVSEAAQASQSTNVTRLNVNGYTDTSGSASYNMKLSYRRADNVAAQLVQDGVPKADIEIKGYGETHLLVPTGPGVREPQNRRVEIILG